MALLAALAACGGDSGTTDSSSGGGANSGGASAPAGSTAGGTGTRDTSIGTVVTDASGRTVYAFTKDAGDASACTGSCAETWPPVPAPATASGNVGIAPRSDGTAQMTFAGHRIYYYAKDEKPGDVRGQAVGNNWFALMPDGSLLKESSGGGSGGY